MIRIEIGLMALLIAGCSSDHMVATDDDNASITVEQIPERCAATCDHYVGCGPEGSCTQDGDLVECVGTPSLEECNSECVQQMTEAVEGGEQCQTLAEQLLDCIDSTPCGEFGARVCRAEAEAMNACLPDSDNDGDKVAPTVDFGAPVPAVECQAGSASGAEPIGDPTPEGVVCDFSWAECSDSREYRVSCVDHQGTGSIVCSCIVDGMVVGGFDGANACTGTAMQHEIANTGCGWNLAY